MINIDVSIYINFFILHIRPYNMVPISQFITDFLIILILSIYLFLSNYVFYSYLELLTNL